MLAAAESADRDATRLVISAAALGELARSRRRVALIALPLFLAVGVGALVVSLDLALLSTVCGFMAFACASIAVEAGPVAREPIDLQITLSTAGLRIGEGSPRSVSAALSRRRYVRLVVANGDGVASLDLPLTIEQRVALAEGLRAAGVELKAEGIAWRLLTFAAALAVGLLVLVLLRVAQGVLAVGVLTAWWLSLVVVVAVVVVVVMVVVVLVVVAWLARRGG